MLKKFIDFWYKQFIYTDLIQSFSLILFKYQCIIVYNKKGVIKKNQIIIRNSIWMKCPVLYVNLPVCPPTDSHSMFSPIYLGIVSNNGNTLLRLVEGNRGRVKFYFFLVPDRNYTILQSCTGSFSRPVTINTLALKEGEGLPLPRTSAVRVGKGRFRRERI